MKTHPIFIAHRGESFDAPENTLSAIKLAWERDVDAVEIDIHLTKDNHIVVIHDANTKRVGNKKFIIADSYYKELKSISVGNKEYPDETIPTLRDVLFTIPSKKKLIIEIKSKAEIILPLINEIKIQNLEHEQIEFICFDIEILSEIKKLLPNYKALWLLELDYNWIHRILQPSIDKFIKKALEHNLDGLDLYSGAMINADLVKKIKSFGLLTYLWTVNDYSAAQKFIDLGIDGITSDRASLLKEEFKK